MMANDLRKYFRKTIDESSVPQWKRRRAISLNFFMPHIRKRNCVFPTTDLQIVDEDKWSRQRVEGKGSTKHKSSAKQTSCDRTASTDRRHFLVIGCRLAAAL